MTNRDSIKSKIFEEEREGFGEGEGKLSRESFPSPSKPPPPLQRFSNGGEAVQQEFVPANRE